MALVCCVSDVETKIVAERSNTVSLMCFVCGLSLAKIIKQETAQLNLKRVPGNFFQCVPLYEYWLETHRKVAVLKYIMSSMEYETSTV